ncbi:MAG: hypothetical protein AB7H93_16515 [Vicinamibacterales bacterium]
MRARHLRHRARLAAERRQPEAVQPVRFDVPPDQPEADDAISVRHCAVCSAQFAVSRGLLLSGCPVPSTCPRCRPSRRAAVATGATW